MAAAVAVGIRRRLTAGAALVFFYTRAVFASFYARAALASFYASAPLAAQAQDEFVRGRVLDAETGAPLAGATVFIRNTPLTATTRADGGFAIVSPSDGPYTLVVVADGFRVAERELQADPSGEIRFVLDRRMFDVPELTVTANRSAARPGEAPVSVAVMSGDELDTRNIVTLDEALPFAQGVIFNSGQMDIRGATGLARGVGSRVLMLLDGHRVLSGVGASIDFSGLPVLDVDQIEIVKGPHSTLWGTNALGGVVNVITKRPPAEPQTIVRGYFGLYDTPARHSFTEERLSREGIALQHSRRLGDVGTTLYLAREESDGFRQNGALERWRLRFKTVFPAESSNPWEIFVNWTRRDEEEFFTWLSADRPLEVDPAELGDWIQTDDVVLGVTANPIVTPKHRVQVRPHVYHARGQNYFHDNEDFHRSTRVGTDIQWSLFPNRSHSLTIGGEGALTGVSSNFLDPTPEVTDLAVFAQDEITFSDRVRGSVGVRLDYHEATAAMKDVVLNPKLGVVYQASERVSLRGSFSRGYRSPSVSEQFTSTTQFGFRVVPNLELRGESAWAREIGTTVNLSDRVWFDAGLFWSDYTDLIEPTAAPDQFFTFQFRNVSEAMVRGVDAGLRVGVIPNRLDLNTSYTFLDTEDHVTGRELPYRSRHNFTATASGWRGAVAVDFRYRSRVEQVLAFPLDERNGITLVDLRVGGRILGTRVQAKIENLLQTTYVDVQERSPGQSRSFRLTVTPRF
ncbi:TonB-dependent receptor [Candidatus Palauibacter sp.]|uniref:TonB-dependent receptor n=1 Tax=Candidatus Palauibacter sp. TaxID=3101350 RepID=UPI003B52E9E6